MRSVPLIFLILLTAAISCAGGIAFYDWYTTLQRGKEDAFTVALASARGRADGVQTSEDMVLKERIPFDAYKAIVIAALHTDDRATYTAANASILRVSSASYVHQSDKKALASLPPQLRIVTTPNNDKASALAHTIGRVLSERQDVVVHYETQPEDIKSSSITCSDPGLCDTLGNQINEILKVQTVAPAALTTSNQLASPVKVAELLLGLPAAAAPTATPRPAQPVQQIRRRRRRR